MKTSITTKELIDLLSKMQGEGGSVSDVIISFDPEYRTKEQFNIRVDGLHHSLEAMIEEESQRTGTPLSAAAEVARVQKTEAMVDVLWLVYDSIYQMVSNRYEQKLGKKKKKHPLSSIVDIVGTDEGGFAQFIKDIDASIKQRMEADKQDNPLAMIEYPSIPYFKNDGAEERARQKKKKPFK